jgi:hypothetical protein
VQDPAAVTQNFESGEHREDKECTGKVNDDVHTSRAAEKEIADEIHDNKEIRNEDNAIHHDESQTKPEEDVAPKPEDNAKIDDTTTTLGGEIIDGNASIKPREIEEIGENKGLESTSNPFVESSIQNNVEHDLHHKVSTYTLNTYCSYTPRNSFFLSNLLLVKLYVVFLPAIRLKMKSFQWQSKMM